MFLHSVYIVTCVRAVLEPGIGKGETHVSPSWKRWSRHWQHGNKEHNHYFEASKPVYMGAMHWHAFHDFQMFTTVEPLSNDHPHQRPSLLYDHISCDGQCFLFVRSLTDDHLSNATSDWVRWNFLPRGRPHRVFQNDCRAAHFTYHFNRW